MAGDMPPGTPVASSWSAEDELRHATSWHRYDARDLADEAPGAPPRLPAGTYDVLNAPEAAEMATCDRQQFLPMLARAQRSASNSALGGGLMPATYREEAASYTPSESIGEVSLHVRGHARAVCGVRRGSASARERARA